MTFYSWGANSYGQLGQGVQSEQSIFPSEIVRNHPLEEVVSAAGGGCHTLVLDSAGALFGTGSNNNGQLGNCKDNTTVLSKIETVQEFKLVQVECGWESSYAITDNGTLVVWGSNRHGQLGIPKDKVTNTNHPLVVNIPRVIQVSAGLRHTAIVTADGHVLTCGQGSKGQLGVDSTEGTLHKKDIDTFVQVKGLKNIKQVACGQHHTLALSADGHLFGWGDNRRGQLGEGESYTTTPRLIATFETPTTVKAGWTHSAVLSDGRVSTWGRNCYSQLGHSFGQPQASQPSQLTGLQRVKQLELGPEHNLALLENGEVWSWGWNEHGNCGIGTVENVPEPRQVSLPRPSSLIAVGAGHSMALCEL